MCVYIFECKTFCFMIYCPSYRGGCFMVSPLYRQFTVTTNRSIVLHSIICCCFFQVSHFWGMAKICFFVGKQKMPIF